MTALRRVEPRDLDLLESQYAGPDEAGEHSWFGYAPWGKAERRLSGRATPADGGLLAVVDDTDRAVGEVSWVPAINGPPPNGTCWNLGIWIAAGHRGHGHGSAAQRQAVAYLFDHTLMERVEAGTEIENIGEQRALERAGFTREGVLRRGCFRQGRWRDMVVYSKLRGEA